jgi:protein-disulfide isomerase
MKPSHFLACAVAVVAIAGCNSKQGDAATNTPLNITPVAAPKGGDWTEMVAATPEGGFRMGNPDAKVKLVEFGSMTCPHCKAFDDEGVDHLVNTYVKSGQVSWEFRNYVRDAFDLAASLVARCNGEKSFFPMTRALYKDQQTWVGKIQAAPQAQLEALQNLPPNRQFLEVSKIAGFQDFAAMRGIPAAKSAQCLSNENSVNQLVQMTSDATSQFPEFQGTPSFIINGELQKSTATWEALEPKLRAALGERG